MWLGGGGWGGGGGGAPCRTPTAPPPQVHPLCRPSLPRCSLARARSAASDSTGDGFVALSDADTGVLLAVATARQVGGPNGGAYRAGEPAREHTHTTRPHAFTRTPTHQPRHPPAGFSPTTALLADPERGVVMAGESAAQAHAERRRTARSHAQRPPPACLLPPPPSPTNALTHLPVWHAHTHRLWAHAELLGP